MADEEDTPKKSGRRLTWRAARDYVVKHKRKFAVAGGLAVFGLLWWLVPLLLYRSGGSPDALLTAVTTTRVGLLAGFVGLGALGTFWVNSRTLRITAKTFEVTEQGHLTDRYTKAIGQLGDEQLDVRLGGIYALERLAIDSERDHPTVVEVLSAFVRERSRPDRTEKPTVAEVLQSLLADSEKPTSGEAQGDGPAPATDVQAALAVLGRLPVREGVSRGDLSGATLTGANLRGANLTGANLRGANLTSATLESANLTRADLTEADLTRASLWKANLTSADLPEADLTGANLLGADLTGATLESANLTDATLGPDLTHAWLYGADLTRARLGGADLTNVNLGEAILTDAHLSGAKLSDANLEQANLANADLGGADLTGAWLRWANLSRAALPAADLTHAGLIEANLTGANLYRANLTSASLERANLTEAKGVTRRQIASALGDIATLLPDGIPRPKSWG
ncbi:pentapeptide repeat-containing protein [Actinomycetospora straminea]|uniref:pentapeptide repeat-containing protein n=1 Tax=Actinomycetospora straminea TaxID=663607 RepID=UPI00236694CC|nr:pentapeptide repeat-containing protein [Actinomycetospora straminea]MDD7936749.1 pentapeptide repeat-containing protein [Actinomycetospora straminea]